MVLAPGGSIVYHPDLMAYLRQNATLIYLEDSLDNISAKLVGGMDRGIVGLKTKPLEQIFKEREPLYAEYADITVNCADKSPDEIIREVLRRFRSDE
jgi:shikimate kinase